MVYKGSIVILSSIIVVMASYSLFSKKPELTPLIMGFFGTLVLVSGIYEAFRGKNRISGYTYILLAFIIFFILALDFFVK
ncbi:hypothetical protein J2S74_000022 [Evansella vedderi]|uniref:DUF3953 domain-containing protein n=1 Tax=Evansella vedderi TaxID=38282 RepID=A0ABT9ZNY8_9BACI|nr:hypothetical protein [Evansella vedderi]MDQ0252650.1 hypothetical protein [Evansella vedderi]